MEKVLPFILVEKAKTVPCQLTWIPQYLSDLETVRVERVETLKEHLILLMKKKDKRLGADHEPGSEEGNYDAEGDEDLISDLDKISYSSRSMFAFLASNLAKVAFLTYIEEFEKAKEMLTSVEETLEELQEDQIETQEGYIDAIKHCISALEWQIDFLELTKTGKLTEESEKEEYKWVELKREQMISTWELLYQRDKRFTAAIEFFKGRLAVCLKTKWEIPRQQFFKAAKLDPGCYIWNHDVYWELRRIRRHPLLGSQVSEPSEEEEYYCRRAYELRPDDPLVKLDYALLLKEDLWGKNREFWSENYDKVQECIRAFEDVLAKTATSYSVVDKESRIENVTVYLAEVLLRTETFENCERGRRLLEQFPESTTALHKLAKLYQYGKFFNGVRKYQNLEKSKELYLQALEIRPKNYPCVKDFVKLLKFDRNFNYELMISVTDRYLKKCNRDALKVDMFIYRGGLLWNYDPRMACQNWVDALTKFDSTYAEKVHEEAKKLILEQTGAFTAKQTLSNMVSILSDLSEIFAEQEHKDKIKAFIFELGKIDLDNVQQNIPSPVRRNRGGGGRGGPRGGRSYYNQRSQGGFQSKTSSPNGNWRT